MKFNCIKRPGHDYIFQEVQLKRGHNTPANIESAVPRGSLTSFGLLGSCITLRNIQDISYSTQ